MAFVSLANDQVARAIESRSKTLDDLLPLFFAQGFQQLNRPRAARENYDTRFHKYLLLGATGGLHVADEIYTVYVAHVVCARL